MSFQLQLENLIEVVDLSLFTDAINGVSLSVLRLDRIHPFVNGNKYFKLKHNLQHVLENRLQGMLTFGGAHSNHIYATAAACKEFNIPCVGVVVGNENALTPTLQFAAQCEMQLHFVHRETYRQKHTEQFQQQLLQQFPNYFIVPEGGSNAMAVKGCAEIPRLVNEDFDFWMLPSGTGGTLAGLALGLPAASKAIGISVLKGENTLPEAVRTLQGTQCRANWEVISGYHFGGYAKSNTLLNDFMNDFSEKTGIDLEMVYSGKLMFAVIDMVRNNFFKPGSKILALHTGGMR